MWQRFWDAKSHTHTVDPNSSVSLPAQVPWPNHSPVNPYLRTGPTQGRKISPNFLNHQRCKSQNQSHHAFMLHKVRISSSLWRATRPILLQFNLYLTALANFCIFSYTLACVFDSLRNSLSFLHYPRFFILALASNWNCRGFFAGSEPCTILFAYSARLLSQRQEAIAKH